MSIIDIQWTGPGRGPELNYSAQAVKQPRPCPAWCRELHGAAAAATFENKKNGVRSRHAMAWRLRMGSAAFHSLCPHGTRPGCCHPGMHVTLYWPNQHVLERKDF